MSDCFSFEITARDLSGRARTGILQTPHGPIQTPVFMPVGTQATVKSLSPQDLTDCGSTIILANTYHLHLRPGDQLVRDSGGLHRFENWTGAILTDSGGFQVFSLRDISKVTDDGVWFQSYIDGSRHFFSPERVIEIQRNLGADIVMMFDECPASSAGLDQIRGAVERTIRWARRCQRQFETIAPLHGYPQALFAIVQGGIVPELRRHCAAELAGMELPGYAIGGLAVGESIASMYDTVAFTAELLPESKPRYLMGVGMPADILSCIERGVDLFDCVLPTRNARNGSAFTSRGKVNIRNAAHTRDFDSPLDSGCGCYACLHFSRAYLRHLFMAGEILAIRMLTLHNVFFYQNLLAQARAHIVSGDFARWKGEALARMASGEGGEAGEPRRGEE